MTVPDRRSLAPMEAIEFAIDRAFRHFFFSVGLVLAWAVVLSPLVVAAWYVAFRNGPPADVASLGTWARVALGVLAAGVLLASFSIAVNWNRRVLTGERPRGLGWVRLDGKVWRYILGFLVLLAVLAVYGAIIFAILTQGVPALAPKLGPAAKPAGIVLAVLFGLSALFSFYRLWSWLAGIAAGDRDYTLGTAWRASRGNRISFLFFTFWLLFALAIAGAIGAGAFLGQQALGRPWASAAGFALIGIVGWIAVFIVTGVAASHYRQFSAPSQNGDDGNQ